MQGDWEGQREIGRHDTVFRYSFSSGNWQTILISFCGAIGLPEPRYFASPVNILSSSGQAQIMVALYLLINGPGKWSINALLDKLRTAKIR